MKSMLAIIGLWFYTGALLFAPRPVLILTALISASLTILYRKRVLRIVLRTLRSPLP